MRDRVLITGITGFIGGHLAQRLLAEGRPVRGLARQPRRAAGLAELGAENNWRRFALDRLKDYPLRC